MSKKFKNWLMTGTLRMTGCGLRVARILLYILSNCLYKCLYLINKDFLRTFILFLSNKCTQYLKCINQSLQLITCYPIPVAPRSSPATCHPQLLIFLVSCSLLFSLSSFAQTVTATIDRGKILLGEQITLELKAQHINSGANPITAWFNLPDTINHLEVVRRSPVDTLNMEGSTSYLQTIVFTSFDSGKWKLPAMQLQLQNSTSVLTTDSFAIEVLPVDVSNLQQYHEMKDIIPVEVQTNWWRIAIITLIMIALAAAVYLYINRKKKTKPAQSPAAKLSLFEDTIAKLEALEKETLSPLLFYTKLDGICRHYLQEQLYLRAMHLSGDELTVQLNIYLQEQEVRIAFYQLLRLVSAVKFAKYAPPPAQNVESIGTAKATVQYIHYHLQRTTQKHA